MPRSASTPLIETQWGVSKLIVLTESNFPDLLGVAVLSWGGGLCKERLEKFLFKTVLKQTNQPLFSHFENFGICACRRRYLKPWSGSLVINQIPESHRNPTSESCIGQGAGNYGRCAIILSSTGPTCHMWIPMQLWKYDLWFKHATRKCVWVNIAWDILTTVSVRISTKIIFCWIILHWSFWVSVSVSVLWKCNSEQENCLPSCIVRYNFKLENSFFCWHFLEKWSLKRTWVKLVHSVRNPFEHQSVLAALTKCERLLRLGNPTMCGENYGILKKKTHK